MRTIPQLREELTDIAIRLRAEQQGPLADAIDEIVQNMHRRKSVRRAPAKQRALTEELRERIRTYAALNPSRTYMEIAGEFNVNSGRVSEAVAGYR